VLRAVMFGVALATLTACGTTAEPTVVAPEPADAIRAGCPDPCTNETPTTPLPPDAYPPLPGMREVTDVGRVTAVEQSGEHPVLVWDRTAFHICSRAELDAASSNPGTCLDGYEERDESHVLRRYRVASDAVVLLPDGRRAATDQLAQLIGVRTPILVSADPAGDVAVIGAAFVP
jgi:hypothetical protein